jgi:2,5-dihydroxypyridine 5,6-dioxygenase
MDIPMRNCSVSLDGEPMTLRGEVIPEDQRVEQQRALV